MISKKGLVALSIVGMFSFAGVQSFAATTASYSTTVGKLGGNGYTGYQKKEVAGQKAKLDSKTTGGYSMYVRTNSSGSEGT